MNAKLTAQDEAGLRIAGVSAREIHGRGVVTRPRGPFAEDASPRALRVSGREARLGVALGAGALLALTATLARAAGRR